jgi:tetratricopeptide (TPR) repeat protein
MKILEDELKSDPNDPHLMLYLADSIKAAGTEEAREKAEKMFLKALESDRPAETVIKRLAYDFLIPRLSQRDEEKDTALKLCDEAISALPDNIDYRYYRAVLNNEKGNYRNALDDLKKCERAFANAAGIPETRVLMPIPILLFYQMKKSAKGLNNKQDTGKNESIINSILKENKSRSEALGPYMIAMFREGKTGSDVFESLSKIYNLGDPRDLLLIARAAKDYGALQFATQVMEMAKELM